MNTNRAHVIAILLCSFIGPSTGLAQERGASEAPQHSQQLGPCPNPHALQATCNDVYQKHESTDPRFEYRYEEKIYRAACADPTIDTEKIAAEKIIIMWPKLRPHLVCDASNFDVSNGDILKYAIAMQAYNLLDSAAEFWGLNLNVVDKSDGRPLLDYLSNEIVRVKGGTQEARLKEYYKILRKNGARHRSELNPETLEIR